MPSLAAYTRLAPFSIDELVDAANSVLRERPRLHVARRTVRYYVTEKVLPSPGGSPKFARYETEHLLRLIGARCLVDLGRSLEDCRIELDRLLAQGNELAVGTIQRLIDAPSRAPVREDEPLSERLLVLASQPPMERNPESRGATFDGLVRRTRLGEGFVLESPAELPGEEALRRAATLIEQALGPT